MKSSFLNLLKNTPTITVRQLQSQISNKMKPTLNPNANNNSSANPSDLKILSPFYQRLNHRPDCTCKYHKRIKSVVAPVRKMKTEGNQATLANNRNTLAVQQVQEEDSGSDYKEDLSFQRWMGSLDLQDMKKYYFEYLKTLPNVDKFKRLDKLDCHNLEFQQFLKDNYLVILKKKAKDEHNRQSKCRVKQKLSSVGNFKSSQKVINKVFTEENIHYEGSLDSNNKKDMFSYKDSHLKTFQSETSEVPSSTLKLKKVGIKGTGKTLQNIGQEQIKKKKDKKRAKFMNSRPSFFGLVEDQQLLRDLCMKLMKQNKKANKQAEFIVKQLVQSDIDMYQRMITDLEGDIESGIKLRNLNEEEANILIKIVLNKIQKQTQQIKEKDQNYGHKNSLIEQLCNKHGWPKTDAIVELKDFWKMRQQKQNSSNSRQSRYSNLNGRSSRSKISRNNIEFKQNKKNKSKPTIQHDSQLLARMSGFNSEKIKSQNMNSVKLVTIEQLDEPPTPMFKINHNKPITKLGVYKSKERRAAKKNILFDSQFRNSRTSKKPFGAINRSQLLDSSQQKPNNSRQEDDDVVVEIQTFKQIQAKEDQIDISSRNSSLYLNLKTQVHKHYQTNKRFLKRIEHNLADNDCERLIIGIKEGIITKKRKIRAIHQALKTEQIKKSQYYNDILKYLQIYEDYCDLVVKVKRQEKKSRTENSHIRLPEHCPDKRKEEEEEDINNLIENLKHDRELKYTNLSLLKEEEDPKEELILKIPQYTTYIQRVRKTKKKVNEKGQNFSSQNQSGAISERFIKQECGILQKDLDGRVKLHCENNWNYEQKIPQQQHIQTKIKQSDKIEHYRAIFNNSPFKK